MDLPTSGGRRVAYFGGSFDPPHLGHLAVARAAQAALALDTVLFAPVGAQPLKPRGSTAAFAHRLAMTRLAIAAQPGFAVSLADAPKPSGAPNYTFETLLALRAELPPEGALFCLMGADAFAGLRRWHRAAEIPFVAPLIVASRPGQRLDGLKAALPVGLTLVGQGFSPDTNRAESAGAGRDGFQPIHLSPEGCFSDHSPGIPPFFEGQIELRRCILRNDSGEMAPLYLLPGLEIEISASEIREQMRIREQVRAAAGGPAPGRALLPAPVSDYIRAHDLYR